MMFYDNTLFLSQTTSTTNTSAEFIITSFNKNMQETLYIIVVYKPPKMKTIYSNSILETILKDMPKDYPSILVRDFNIGTLKKHLNQQHFKTLCTNTN
jgi:hypothetical protein